MIEFLNIVTNCDPNLFNKSFKLPGKKMSANNSKMKIKAKLQPLSVSLSKLQKNLVTSQKTKHAYQTLQNITEKIKERILYQTQILCQILMMTSNKKLKGR